MEDSEAITKRLSFGEVSQHLNATQQLDVQDVIKALKHPSVDNFQRYIKLNDSLMPRGKDAHSHL